MLTAATSLQETSSLYRIEPFNGKNWAPWKFKVQLILSDMGVWEHVIGTTTCPAPADPAAVTPAEAEAIAA